MVVERSAIADLSPRRRERTHTNPADYRIVIRIDDRKHSDLVTSIITEALGDIPVYSRLGSKISGRVWLETEPFHREIAETKAEAIRRGAYARDIGLNIHIRKV